MKRIFYIILLIFLNVGCATYNKIEVFSTNAITFGYGGGITGATTEYILYYNGNVEEYNSLTDSKKSITQISHKKSKEFFHRFLRNGFDTLTYLKPGNMSRFLGFKNDSITHKIIWSNSIEPPSNIKNMYDDLIQIVKSE